MSETIWNILKQNEMREILERKDAKCSLLINSALAYIQTKVKLA